MQLLTILVNHGTFKLLSSPFTQLYNAPPFTVDNSNVLGLYEIFEIFALLAIV